MSRKDTQLTIQADLDETRRVFEELRRYVASEPQLSGFLSVVLELEEQARSLVIGKKDVPALTAKLPTSIPSKHLAEQITEIVSKLPAVGEDFDEDTKLGLGRLLENLVIGVTGFVFSDFPELTRLERQL